MGGLLGSRGVGEDVFCGARQDEGAESIGRQGADQCQGDRMSGGPNECRCNARMEGDIGAHRLNGVDAREVGCYRRDADFLAPRIQAIHVAQNQISSISPSLPPNVGLHYHKSHAGSLQSDPQPRHARSAKHALRIHAGSKADDRQS